MNKYIFFRTDRIGDFLLSAVLIKSVKRNDPNSHITLVSSKKIIILLKILILLIQQLFIQKKFLIE